MPISPDNPAGLPEREPRAGCRLAVFDFDGTLADSADWAFGVFNEVARHHGFRTITTAEREMLRGRSNREVLAFLQVPMWRLPSIARHMRALAKRDAEAIRPFPWVPDLLECLRNAGIRIAVVTSNSEENVRRTLGASAKYVDHIAAGASLFGKASKMRKAMKAAGIGPADTVAVGDEVRDVEAGREAGVRTMAVGWGLATAASLLSAEPDLFVDTPETLLESLIRA